MKSNIHEIRHIIPPAKAIKYESIRQFNPYTQGRIQQDFNSRADYGSSPSDLYTRRKQRDSQSSIPFSPQSQTYQLTAQHFAGNYSMN